MTDPAGAIRFVFATGATKEQMLTNLAKTDLPFAGPFLLVFVNEADFFSPRRSAPLEMPEVGQ